MTDFPVLTADSIFEHAKAHFDAKVLSGGGAIKQSIEHVLTAIADQDTPDHPHAKTTRPEWYPARHYHFAVKQAFRKLTMYACETYDHYLTPEGFVRWIPHDASPRT